MPSLAAVVAAGVDLPLRQRGEVAGLEGCSIALVPFPRERIRSRSVREVSQRPADYRHLSVRLLRRVAAEAGVKGSAVMEPQAARVVAVQVRLVVPERAERVPQGREITVAAAPAQVTARVAAAEERQVLASTPPLAPRLQEVTEAPALQSP